MDPRQEAADRLRTEWWAKHAHPGENRCRLMLRFFREYNNMQMTKDFTEFYELTEAERWEYLYYLVTHVSLRLEQNDT